jgi:short-subunit dehydrogenase
MKSIIIMGASSGIGREVAKIYIRAGWRVGIAARRMERLENLRTSCPERIYCRAIDITDAESPQQIWSLIEEMGGIDVYLHVSGIGIQTEELHLDKELHTLGTNGEGFVRSIVTAFNYFEKKGGGHIAAVTSIAATKGLAIGAMYSATKRFQVNYLQALAQLANMRHLHIAFTDIRPGFVHTDLLADGRHYPLKLKPEKVAAAITRAIERKSSVCTIDWRYAILVFAWRLVPNALWKHLPIRSRK